MRAERLRERRRLNHQYIVDDSPAGIEYDHVA
jgi:septum formation inhibitor-activating ATPase MinD